MDMMRRRDGNEVKVRNQNTVSAPQHGFVQSGFDFTRENKCE